MSSKPKREAYKADSVMDANVLSQWLSSSKPSDCIVYHRGMLSNDRQVWVSNKAPKDVIKRIDAVGKLAMLFASAGHVVLLQRKHGMQDYEYLAYRRQAGPRAMSISELVKP